MDPTIIPEEINPLKAYRDVMGKNVYSFREGKKAGLVKEVFFDTNFEKLTAAGLGKQGFFSRRNRIVRLDNIKVFGSDILIISSVKDIEKCDKNTVRAMIPLSIIRGKEIVDRGIKLAVAGDVVVSGQGQVDGITLSKVLVEGKIDSLKILRREAITEIGDDAESPIHIDLDKV